MQNHLRPSETAVGGEQTVALLRGAHDLTMDIQRSLWPMPTGRSGAADVLSCSG